MMFISLRQVLTYAAVASLFLLADPIPSTYAAGCVLAFAGILMRVWGCGHLRKNEELVTSGPYAHVKHPLYLGTFLIALGGIVAAGSPRVPGILLWIVAGPVFLGAFFGYYLPRKKRVEGERMARFFGESYAEYARNVPDFFPSSSPWSGAASRPWDYATFRRNHEIGMDLLVAGLFAAILLLPPVLQGLLRRP